MTKIEQLENELNESLNIRHLLHEKLETSLRTLIEIETLLKIVNTDLKHSNEYIYTLEQENRKLKSSCDEWVKRAIRLEFEVLSARDTAQK
ncbi:MAG: hypothetical protein QX199_09090 [Methylococcaceae bacterium]